MLSQRTPLTKKEFAAIEQPVLLIHGDKNQIHPIQHAHNMVADLINAKGGAKMYTIKGIPEWDSFARVTKMVTFCYCRIRWSRVHQRVVNNSISLQSGVLPVHFASTSCAIRATSPKRSIRGVHLTRVGNLGRFGGRPINFTT